jgi:hypothetical protein
VPLHDPTGIVSRAPVNDAAGQVVYKLKNPFRDGTTHVLFSPEEFIARLAALVPRLRVNLTRYHGVFTPSSCGIRKSEIETHRQGGCRGPEIAQLDAHNSNFSKGKRFVSM